MQPETTNQFAEIIQLVGLVLAEWEPEHHGDGDYPCRAVRWDEVHKKWGSGACNCGAQESIDLRDKLRLAISKWMDDPSGDEKEAKQHTRESILRDERDRYQKAEEMTEKWRYEISDKLDKMTAKCQRLEAENSTLKQAASIWAATALAPKKPISEAVKQDLETLGKSAHAASAWCRAVENILNILCKQ